MKYSENLVQRTIKAINNLPFQTVWNVYKRRQYETYCEIRFEDIDGFQMSINIGETEISAIAYLDDSGNNYKWFGDCHMKQNNIDTYMMWLGTIIYQMLKYIDKKKEELQ